MLATRRGHIRDIEEVLGSGYGFWRQFPPDGVEVVSWYVMMGVGQVVTLRLPAHRLREVNPSIERCAWGSFSTEFYPTYDFRPVWEGLKSKNASPS